VSYYQLDKEYNGVIAINANHALEASRKAFNEYIRDVKELTVITGVQEYAYV
jgi:hypothetical protein